MTPLLLLTWLAILYCGSAGTWVLIAAISPPPAERRLSRASHFLPDGGMAIGRVLFLTVWGLLGFWGGTLGLPVGLGAWFWIVPVLAAMAALAKFPEKIASYWSAHRPGIWRGEIVFVAVFLLFFFLRGWWSDTGGTNGEKSMDMALISALTRAGHLPPANPYAAGAPLQAYYYFGHLQTALWSVASGGEPRWTYNLMAATLPALCFGVLWQLGWGVTRRFWGGGVLAGAVLLLGTLGPLDQWIRRAGGLGTPGQEGRGLWESFKGGIDYFATSRIIPFTINEYPWFTFTYGDLHAHYFGIPLYLTQICLCLVLWRGKSWPLAAIPLVLAAQVLTNTWDGVTSALIVLGTIALAPAMRRSWASSKGKRLALGGALLALALLLASPYLLHLKTAANPPRWLQQPASPTVSWLTLWGPFATCWALAIVCGVLAPRFKEAPSAARTVAIAAAFWGLVAGLISLATRQDWGVSALLCGLVLLPLYAYGKVTHRIRPWLLLGTVGLAALVWSELTWAGFLGNPQAPRIEEFVRQDTVFKFGMQAWLCWGTAAIVMVMLTYRRWPRVIKPGVTAVAMCCIAIMLCATWSATRARARGWSQWDGWDAWKHLSPAEQEAAAWLRSHTQPGENLVEAAFPNGGDYTEYTRFTAATGIPTIMGPVAHTFQWAPANSGKTDQEWAAVQLREQAVAIVYLSPDAGLVAKTLREYRVRYIVLGDLEYQTYGAAPLVRLQKQFPQAFASGELGDPHRTVILVNPEL